MSRRTKLISVFGALIALVAFVLVFFSPSAGAHTPSVTSTCSSLKIDLENYANAQHGAANTIKVTVDGKEVENTTFGKSYIKEFPLAQYSNHTYLVDVVAWDNGHYNVHQSGTTTACSLPPAPKDTKVYDGKYHFSDCDNYYESDQYTVTHYTWDGTKWVGSASVSYENQKTVRPINKEEQQAYWERGMCNPPKQVPVTETEHRWVSTPTSCNQPNETRTYQERIFYYTDNGDYSYTGHWTEWSTVKSESVANTTYPCAAKIAKVHIKVIDRCRCKHDSVRVSGSHLRFNKVQQNKNTWKIVVVSDKGYTVAKHLNGSGKQVHKAVYTVHTSNKPCPCEKNDTCHAAAKPAPVVPSCGCTPRKIV